MMLPVESIASGVNYIFLPSTTTLGYLVLDEHCHVITVTICMF